MPFIASLSSAGGSIGGGAIPVLQSDNGLDVVFDDPQGTFTPDPLATLTVNLPASTTENDMLHYDSVGKKWIANPVAQIGANALVGSINSIAIGNDVSTVGHTGAIALSSNATGSADPESITISTSNSELLINGGYIEANGNLYFLNDDETKNLKIEQDQYITLNSTQQRIKNYVTARWSVPSGSPPTTFQVLHATPTFFGIPNISLANQPYNTEWQVIDGGLKWNSSETLEATISISVALGRQSPGGVLLDLIVPNVIGAALTGNVARFRSNGAGVCSFMSWSGKATILPQQEIKPYIRNRENIDPTTVQINLQDALLCIY